MGLNECSVEFNSRWYLCARKSPYDIRSTPSFRKFPNVAFETIDGLLSSFQGRSSSASFSHASLLQAIDGSDVLGFVPAGGVNDCVVFHSSP